MKYKYIIFDIDGYLKESNKTYKTYEQAEKECIKEMDDITKKARQNFENALLSGYSIEEVDD